MRLFSSLPLIALLLVMWPAMLFAFVFACAWLERSTLPGDRAEDRRAARASAAPPGQPDGVVLGEAAELVTGYWATNGVNGAAPQPEPAVRRSAAPGE